MHLTVDQCVDAIARHTHQLADAADGHLERPVRHCPGWTVGDLVWHLTEVQWFWRWVATERPTDRPAYVESPEQPGPEALLDGLRSGVEALVEALATADQDASCWTWGSEHRVGFITRHQVQEAAVHHWDALDAVGRASSWEMWPVDAIDAVDEFLTESVANERWPRPEVPRMDGTIWFCPCHADTALCPTWHVTDGARPGTLEVRVDPEGSADGVVIGSHGHPATLLLWLYGRVPEREAFPDLDLTPEQRALLQRFRAFASTD